MNICYLSFVVPLQFGYFQVFFFLYSKVAAIVSLCFHLRSVFYLLLAKKIFFLLPFWGMLKYIWVLYLILIFLLLLSVNPEVELLLSDCSSSQFYHVYKENKIGKCRRCVCCNRIAVYKQVIISLLWEKSIQRSFIPPPKSTCVDYEWTSLGTRSNIAKWEEYISQAN